RRDLLMRGLSLSMVALLASGCSLIFGVDDHAAGDRDGGMAAAAGVDAGREGDGGPRDPGATPDACLASEVGVEACGNALDDDCDGLVDCDETSCCGFGACACEDAGTCTATGPEDNDVVCSDGLDNDCDGTQDCDDADC